MSRWGPAQHPKSRIPKESARFYSFLSVPHPETSELETKKIILVIPRAAWHIHLAVFESSSDKACVTSLPAS